MRCQCTLFSDTFCSGASGCRERKGNCRRPHIFCICAIECRACKFCAGPALLEPILSISTKIATKQHNMLHESVCRANLGPAEKLNNGGLGPKAALAAFNLCPSQLQSFKAPKNYVFVLKRWGLKLCSCDVHIHTYVRTYIIWGRE